MVKRAFTLVELAVILAIIAIVAIAAIPNFIESQYRAKVSRGKAELRTAALALNAYAVDWGKYPYDGYNYSGVDLAYGYWYLSKMLSTPQAYLTTCVVPDPFRVNTYWVSPFIWQSNNIRYLSTDSTWGTTYDGIQSTAPGFSIYYSAMLSEFGNYHLVSVGPDGTYGPYGWNGVSSYPSSAQNTPYDPTNGTLSNGDIIRSQICEIGYLNMNP